MHRKGTLKEAEDPDSRRQHQCVDTATEAAIRTAFREDLKDTTKFIIAQRLSSLEYADRILVLEDGRIIGEGTQEKLLASCEAYREIYETQYGKRADGEGMA